MKTSDWIVEMENIKEVQQDPSRFSGFRNNIQWANQEDHPSLLNHINFLIFLTYLLNILSFLFFLLLVYIVIKFKSIKINP